MEGTVTLQSPVFDLTGYSDPYLNYYHWFYDFYGSMYDDTLEIYLSNGTDEVRLEAYNGQNSIGWHARSFRISDHLTPTAAMQLRVTTTEQGEQNVVEAGFDAFAVSEGEDVLGFGAQQAEPLRVWPNPVTEELFVLAEGEFAIVSPHGIVVLQGVVQGTEAIDVRCLPAGIYFLKTGEQLARFVKL